MSSATEYWPRGQTAPALRHLVPGPGLWFLLGGLFSLNMLWLASNPRLSLALGWEVTLPGVVAIFPVALIYRERRDAMFDRPLRVMFGGMLVMLFASCQMQQMRLFNQLALSVALPWADDLLMKWDAALGFDWNAYAAAIAAHPLLQAGLRFAYFQAVPLGLGGLLFWAVWRQDRARVDEIAFLAIVSGVVCIAISVLFPAVSPWQTVATLETA